MKTSSKTAYSAPSLKEIPLSFGRPLCISPYEGDSTEPIGSGNSYNDEIFG